MREIRRVGSSWAVLFVWCLKIIKNKTVRKKGASRYLFSYLFLFILFHFTLFHITVAGSLAAAESAAMSWVAGGTVATARGVLWAGWISAALSTCERSATGTNRMAFLTSSSTSYRSDTLSFGISTVEM